jgi:hypothetical protein
MSFNKRYFNKEQIIKFAGSNDFRTFNKWISGHDSAIFDDDFSSSFVDVYFRLSENERMILKDSFSEGEYFIQDLIKILKVARSIDNKREHKNAIENYLDLFTNKWPLLVGKYKNIIIKDNNQ